MYKERTILIVTGLRKLPKNCARCHYYVPRSRLIADLPVCLVSNDRAIEGKANNGRQEWCPLIESRPCKTIIDVRDQEV